MPCLPASLPRRCAANKDFTAWPIIQWLLAATFQSGIIMVLVLVGTPGTAASVAGGQAWGMAEVGVIMFGAIVITVHLQLVIVEEQFTWIHHAAIWASIGERGCVPVLRAVASSMPAWVCPGGVHPRKGPLPHSRCRGCMQPLVLQVVAGARTCARCPRGRQQSGIALRL